jgi:hypothetical protein
MTAPRAEDRDWTRVREAAIHAVTAVTGDPQAAPVIADAVLAVCDEEAVSPMAGQMVEATRNRPGVPVALRGAWSCAGWVRVCKGLLGGRLASGAGGWPLAGDAGERAGEIGLGVKLNRSI